MFLLRDNTFDESTLSYFRGVSLSLYLPSVSPQQEVITWEHDHKQHVRYSLSKFLACFIFTLNCMIGIHEILNCTDVFIVYIEIGWQ